MKYVLVASIFLSSLAFAKQEFPHVVRDQVGSAVMTEEDGKSVLSVEMWSGGCSPEAHEPKIDLELVSIKDRTPQWALDKNPDMTREYSVVMKAVAMERSGAGGMCAMAYTLTAKANLRELFKQKAKSLGYDLKKAHYSVTFELPQVVTSESFATWDEE